MRLIPWLDFKEQQQQQKEEWVNLLNFTDILDFSIKDLQINLILKETFLRGSFKKWYFVVYGK